MNIVQKLGRNDPCHCNSGQKYKRCCLPKGVFPQVNEKTTISVPAQQESQQRLVKRVHKNIGDSYALLKGELPSKMSAIILKLADFLLEASNTKQQEQAAVSIACLAWNMSILSATEGEKAWNEFFNEQDDPVFQEDTKEIIEIIMARKKHHYPNVNRIIVDFELLQNKKDMHLTIMSIVPEEEAAEAKLLT